MATSAGQKKLGAMKTYLNSVEISDFYGNKKGFENASKSFLRQLLKDIGQTLTDKYGEPSITEQKVSFNPGGPAVAGDPSLYFMTSKNNGLSIYISDSFMRTPQKQCILYREISSMKDYKGGGNNWLSVNKPYEEIVNKLSGFLDMAINREAEKRLQENPVKNYGVLTPVSVSGVNSENYVYYGSMSAGDYEKMYDLMGDNDESEGIEL